MILILSGEPGSGKTDRSMLFEEPIKILDMENRDQRSFDRNHSDRIIDVFPILVKINHVKDYYQSYLNLRKTIDTILKSKPDFRTLVLDGISDVRGKYAKAKWFNDHPKRKNPQPEEWTEINETTRQLLDPLIDMARDFDFHLIFTAQFCDEYGKVEKQNDNGKIVIGSEKLGREPNVEDWQAYNVDTHIILEYRKPKYFMNCIKSIAGCWEEDITGKNLYDILIKKGV